MNYEQWVQFEKEHYSKDMSFKTTKKLLDWVQQRIDEEYDKHGLTPKVLARQVRLNKLRTMFDIVDKNNIIEDNDEYVQ